MSADDAVQGLGRCVGCGHDPACGFASIWTAKGGEWWYCHTDDHDCYGPAAADLLSCGQPS